jgi:hypothetical protein
MAAEVARAGATLILPFGITNCPRRVKLGGECIPASALKKMDLSVQQLYPRVRKCSG